MAAAALIPVPLPADLIAQAAALTSPGRSLQEVVATALQSYLRDLAEFQRITAKWRQESWEQGLRSEEDLQSVLDGTLTLEELTRRV